MSRFALALLLTLTVGCASRTSPYDVEPEAFEANREAFGRVAIALVDAPGSMEVVEPAKGWWGGLKRGAWSGAMTPIVIGFLTPVPGGSFFGALLAPFGAAIGGTYGMIVAPSTDVVETAEAGIESAVERLVATDVRGELLGELVRTASDRSAFEVSAAPSVPADEEGELELAPLPLDVADTVVLIGPSKAGLAGERSLDPPLTAAFDVRVRVLHLSGEAPPATIYDYEVRCRDAERGYSEWGAEEGRAFEGAVRNCFPLLIEKVVEDLFVLHRPTEEES